MAGPSTAPTASSCCSRKRKQPDEDEQVLIITPGPLTEEPIENEYEHLDEDDADGDADEDGKWNKTEYNQILRAQKPSTITQYDDIKITPFNLDDELEEGEFDSAGNFIFRREKEKDENKNDTWAESIDWAAVEKQEKDRREKANVEQSSQAKAETDPVRDKATCYRQMLRLMRADETVQRTIRRLGNDVPKRRPYNKSSKNKTPSEGTSSLDGGDGVVEARRKLDLMIELAHQRLEDGDTDIYQKTYDDLEDAIN